MWWDGIMYYLFMYSKEIVSKMFLILERSSEVYVHVYISVTQKCENSITHQLYIVMTYKWINPFKFHPTTKHKTIFFFSWPTYLKKCKFKKMMKNKMPLILREYMTVYYNPQIKLVHGQLYFICRFKGTFSFNDIHK